MGCFDLREVCRARRWRFRFEAAFNAEGLRSSSDGAEWYVEVLGRRGMIYPLGGAWLAVFSSGRRRHELLAIPGVRPHREGDGELVGRFDVVALDAIAEWVKPRRRRPGNPEATARLLSARIARSGAVAGARTEALDPARV